MFYHSVGKAGDSQPLWLKKQNKTSKQTNKAKKVIQRFRHRETRPCSKTPVVFARGGWLQGLAASSLPSPHTFFKLVFSIRGFPTGLVRRLPPVLSPRVEIYVNLSCSRREFSPWHAVNMRRQSKFVRNGGFFVNFNHFKT